MPKQMGYEMRFKTKPVEVEAFQFTEQLRDAIILDGAEYPSGVTSGSAEFHRANRKVWHANFYIDDSRKLIALGDWIITGADGKKTLCEYEEFLAKYEPA